VGLISLLIAFILWVAFFQAGHILIVKGKAKFIVLLYTAALLAAYIYYLFIEKAFAKSFLENIAFSAPLIILVWTIFESLTYKKK